MRKIYFYYQNLKKEDHERGLVHGRCWIGNNQFHAEWSIPSRFWMTKLSLNHYGDTAIGFHLSLGLFSIYLSSENRKLYRFLERFTKRKDQKYTNGREIGVSYHSSTFWFSLWEDPMESRSKDPWWWHFSFNCSDFLFGRAKCNTEVLKEGTTKIEMPEGDYDATYKIEKRTWKRARSPFCKTRTDVSFEIPVGIPHEGKGENSWDCGMDATFGCGAEWNGRLHEATKKVAMNALRTRQRYGSLNSPAYAKWRKEGLERIKTQH